MNINTQNKSSRKKNRRYMIAQTKLKTGYAERSPNNVTPMLREDTDMLCQCSWEQWDFLVELLTKLEHEAAEPFVVDVQTFKEKGQNRTIWLEDAVPVYLALSVWGDFGASDRPADGACEQVGASQQNAEAVDGERP